MDDIIELVGQLGNRDIEKYISLFDSIHDFKSTVSDLIRKRRENNTYDYTKDLYFNYLREIYNLPDNVTLACSRLKTPSGSYKGPSFLNDIEDFYIQNILKYKPDHIKDVPLGSYEEQINEKSD